jgi:2',3'-cyclic-nucleotide 2'-phosphodiesterase
VINVMGVAKMEALADPFAAVDQELDSCPLKTGCDASLIDFHAELTSEKMALGHYVDGRTSLMVGTHTHVPTADHRILDRGTAYVTDAGMCGDYDSVIGMDKEEPLNRFLRKIPLGRFTPATGPATVTGIAVLTDDRTGLALKVAPVRIGGWLEPAWPEW